MRRGKTPVVAQQAAWLLSASCHGRRRCTRPCRACARCNTSNLPHFYARSSLITQQIPGPMHVTVSPRSFPFLRDKDKDKEGKKSKKDKKKGDDGDAEAEEKEEKSSQSDGVSQKQGAAPLPAAPSPVRHRVAPPHFAPATPPRDAAASPAHPRSRGLRLLERKRTFL